MCDEQAYLCMYYSLVYKLFLVLVYETHSILSAARSMLTPDPSLAFVFISFSLSHRQLVII